jgi:hypothetical protein
LITLVAVAAGAAACFGFPDLDIPLLGIGNHRYFLFHSAAAPVALYTLLRPSRRERGRLVLAVVTAAFAVGVGVHLFTDAFQTKPVVFPFAKTLVRGTSLDDRLWEGLNAAACGVLAWVSLKGARQR